MERLLQFHEAGLHVVIGITDEGEVLFLHCSALPFDLSLIDPTRTHAFRFFALQLVGENVADHHGTKHTGTLPGQRLRYHRHHEYMTTLGRKLEIEARDPNTGIRVLGHLQFFQDLPSVRMWTEVIHEGNTPIILSYIASFAYMGLDKESAHDWKDTLRLSLAYNSWQAECQWHQFDFPEVGFAHVAPYSTKRVSISNLGTWSTSQYLPMGMVENRETSTALAWQIEHNGSWHWEISDYAHHLYVQISGPTAQEHQWEHQLLPGKRFETVPVAIVVGKADATKTAFEDVMSVLTWYRRRIRRPSWDTERLPVIFNDYMNSLNADPTTDKELPLIARAAQAGCEIYCIDAGWYADGPWWDSVGEWKPVEWRFPEGFTYLLDRIRDAGMVPGLWVEIEVIGTQSSLAKQVPDAWFFCHHGQRVQDHGRFQLDFRHPDVQSFADTVIDRFVQEYGIGYIKIDYNNNFAPGTEIEAISLGDGLLQHNRAYLAWLDRVFARYPDLIIENCASGGLRMDYALLRRHSIQSISDQTDYRHTSVIAAAAATAVTPEQGAIWAYPLAKDDEDGVHRNLVNALLGRIHLSGQLAELSPDAFDRVCQGIAMYKHIRDQIPQGIPFWPLGTPLFSHSWLCYGLDCTTTFFVAIWRNTGNESTIDIPLPRLRDHDVRVACLYPEGDTSSWQWHAQNTTLTITIENRNSARLFAFETAKLPSRH